MPELRAQKCADQAERTIDKLVAHHRQLRNSDLYLERLLPDSIENCSGRESHCFHAPISFSSLNRLENLPMNVYHPCHPPEQAEEARPRTCVCGRAAELSEIIPAALCALVTWEYIRQAENPWENVDVGSQ